MWLEEVKMDIVEHDNQHKKPTYVLVRRTSADRMIAIVEGAEWTNDMKLTVYPTGQCPICYAQKEDGHLPVCPYSDDREGP